MTFFQDQKYKTSITIWTYQAVMLKLAYLYHDDSDYWHSLKEETILQHSFNLYRFILEGLFNIKEILIYLQ